MGRAIYMSTVLEIWSEDPFDLKENLINYEKYQKYEDEWSYEGEGWQVLIWFGMSNHPPVSVRNKLACARYIAYTSIDPSGPDVPGCRFFEDSVRTLTKGSNGVWVNSDGEAFGPDEGIFEYS
jgi:hypothetical protein